MDWHVTGVAVSAVLERAALARSSVVRPVRAGAWHGMRQDHFSPAVLWQAREVFPAQVGGFLGSQGGVVHASEECLHPVAALAVCFDGGEEPAGLGRVDDDAWVDGCQGAGPGPFHGLERVSGKGAYFAGV